MSYKIGDKIELKKQETTLESTFNDILSVLRSPKMKETDKLQWCNSALSILEEMYNPYSISICDCLFLISVLCQVLS